jgi:site-specific recombinase XerD
VREQDASDALNSWFDQHREVPMMHNAINRRVKTLADQAGIERDLTAHDLRDTYATMLVRKGFDEAPIKRLMGHNDPERLEDYFKFVGKHQQREFIEKW